MMPALVRYDRSREDLVQRSIEARGLCSRPVLAAMRKVRRELYVPEELREFAYEDSPLPIGEGQTISQPYIVALMLEAARLEGGERVLEIGTGCGYSAAVAAEIASEVYTIERLPVLARRAEHLLWRQGYRNVHVRHGDGTLGWPDAAPFDAILVTAAGPRVPQALRNQLAVGGTLVIPVSGPAGRQRLKRVTRRTETDYVEELLADVVFVPLIGAEGWRDDMPARSA